MNYKIIVLNTLTLYLHSSMGVIKILLNSLIKILALKYYRTVRDFENFKNDTKYDDDINFSLFLMNDFWCIYSSRLSDFACFKIVLFS